jgi:hypothetical protein
MAASSFDVTSVPGAHKRRRRFIPQLPQVSLPRFKPAGLGGGFGLLVIALGLLAIGIGWNGMAGGGGQVNGVSDLRAQLPWLISGGALGLALVVFGAAMMVVHNARIDRARLESKLDELVGVISRQALAANSAYPSEAPVSTAGLYAAGGTSYHQPGCRLVEGRDDIALLTASEVASRDLRPCRVCKPETIETLAN